MWCTPHILICTIISTVHNVYVLERGAWALARISPAAIVQLEPHASANSPGKHEDAAVLLSFRAGNA